MTVASIRSSSYIADCARVTLEYGKALVQDIPADQFALCSHPTINHPAFCIGHLSIYPDKVLGFIGRDELINGRDDYEALFKAGVKCQAEPAVYPPKDELLAYYVERYTTATDALQEVGDDLLSQDNPREGRFKQMFPTIGSAVNFLLVAHHMSHLGQISAWRRTVSLPSVF